MPGLENLLDVGGEYAVRHRGEKHTWDSDNVKNLQHAVRSNNPKVYDDYAKSINIQDQKLMTLRGLFQSRMLKIFQKNQSL